MRKFLSLIAFLAVCCTFTVNASALRGQDKKAPEKKLTAKEKTELVKGLVEKIDELKMDVDLKAASSIMTKVIDLPKPTAGYDAFNIPSKDGSPLKTQVKTGGGVTFNSDGSTAVIGSLNGGVVLLAPEGSGGFGSNKKDLKVVFIGYDAKKKVFEDPIQVVGKLSEQYKPNSEYMHGSENAGFLLILPVAPPAKK